MPVTQTIRVGRVFTAASDTVLEDALVTIEGSRIASVQPFGAVAGAAEADVHHPDATLLPGLIDAHCHLTLSGYEKVGEEGRSYEDMIADPDELMAIIALRNLRTHLASGVTSLRDNGGRNRITFAVREAVRRGYAVAPRLLLSGRPVTHSRGHFDWCNGEADGSEGVRQAVRRLVAEGADHIKIMASGGGTVGTPPEHASYTVEELRTAADTAHGLGRLTTAHCRARRSMEHAIEAGLDCIEHAEFLVPAPGAELGKRVPASGAPNALVEYDPTVTEGMLRSGMYASITLQQGGYDRLVELRAKADGGGLDDRERRWRQQLEARYEVKLETFSQLLSDGMQPQLVISSDAGVRNTAFGKMAYGLELAVAAGLSPSAAIIAATRTAAQACGLAHLVGTIEAGKEADLLLIDGDPTEDVGRIADVVAVYRAGTRVVSRQDAPP
jgi:imidazolonepropionase-like amidohydrolase